MYRFNCSETLTIGNPIHYQNVTPLSINDLNIVPISFNKENYDIIFSDSDYLDNSSIEIEIEDINNDYIEKKVQSCQYKLINDLKQNKQVLNQLLFRVNKLSDNAVISGRKFTQITENLVETFIYNKIIKLSIK